MFHWLYPMTQERELFFCCYVFKIFIPKALSCIRRKCQNVKILMFESISITKITVGNCGHCFSFLDVHTSIYMLRTRFVVYPSKILKSIYGTLKFLVSFKDV